MIENEEPEPTDAFVVATVMPVVAVFKVMVLKLEPPPAIPPPPEPT
jgi:hypothetical protein